MRVRFLAIPLLLTAAALTGCIAGEEAPPAAEEAPEQEQSLPEDMPDGRDGDFAAFNETQDFEDGKGGLDHHHDNWGGQNQIAIYSGHHEMNPAPYASGTDAIIVMPEGSLVYEGTEHVEFTISNPGRHACFERFIGTINGENTCTDHNGVGAPEGPSAPDPNPPALTLEYRHASTTDWLPVGALTWGSPVSIPISNPAETDMPHSTTSLWQFRVVSTTPLDTTLVFDAVVTIFRGPADIPLWPGHPDFYAKTPIRVVQDEIPAITKDYGQRAYNGVQPSEVTSVRPEKLISYGTKTLYVYMNITDYKGTPGFEPHTWYLYFHNASGGWNITDSADANNAVGTATNLLFVLKVDDNGMDSPYAPSSRWEFQLRGSFNTDALSCYLDCADYEVSYTAKIIATNQLAKEYTCGGVGEDVCPAGAPDEE